MSRAKTTATPAPDNQLLAMPEVAKRLGVSLTQAYRYTKAGDLPCVRLGPRALRVTEQDLATFIRSRRSA